EIDAVGGNGLPVDRALMLGHVHAQSGAHLAALDVSQSVGGAFEGRPIVRARVGRGSAFVAANVPHLPKTARRQMSAAMPTIAAACVAARGRVDADVRAREAGREAPRGGGVRFVGRLMGAS